MGGLSRHVLRVQYPPRAGRSLTRPSATLSQGARVKKPLSRWERGWGEGKTAGPVHLRHASKGRGDEKG